jgi:hypothetical protein
VLDCVRITPCRHQPVMQSDIGLGEMSDECPIEANEALAVVKIGESEPVAEGEIGHQEVRPSAAEIPRISICS